MNWFLSFTWPPAWMLVAGLAFLVVLGLLILAYALCAAAGLDVPEPRDPVLDSDQYRAETQARLLRMQDRGRKP